MPDLPRIKAEPIHPGRDLLAFFGKALGWSVALLLAIELIGLAVTYGTARAEPTGRARNSIPNVASDASVAEAESKAGKNSRGKTSTAAVA